MSCLAAPAHDLQRIGAGVWPLRFTGKMDGGFDIGVARRHLACNGQTCVVCSPRAKEDFKRRIVLFEEACEVPFQIGFVAVEGLQYAYRRKKRGRSRLTTPGTISNNACYHHDAVDRGGNEAKYAQGEQEMEHRDTVSPVTGNSCSLDYSGDRTSAYGRFLPARVPRSR